MAHDLFGAATSGRLHRLRFIVLWLTLMMAFVVFAVLVGFGIGIAERLVGGDLVTAQKILTDELGIPAIIAVSTSFVLFGFCLLNIVAKRARDVGLPGWITAIVLVGLFGGISQVLETSSATGTGMLLLVGLAALPTDFMHRKT